MTRQEDELAEKNKRLSGVAKQKYLAIMLRLCLHESNSFSIPIPKIQLQTTGSLNYVLKTHREMCGHIVHIFL